MAAGIRIFPRPHAARTGIFAYICPDNPFLTPIIKTMEKRHLLLASLALAWGMAAQAQVPASGWTADNGNGTYTNPLFYDEFSDPDILRVGEDYYLAGTTMHTVPGLVILHSKDLVNWDFCSYAFDEYDESYVSGANPMDAFCLRGGREIYGQGVWAPVIRYHGGQFYVFTNVNGSGLQVYTSSDPRGPWKHHNMSVRIYDLSILFDDDGRVYAIHNYGAVKVTELKADLSGVVEGTERVVIPDGNAMGEGFHAYKIDGYYYILSADYKPNGRLMVARSRSIYGPYETRVMGAEETLGTPVFPMTTGRLNPLPQPGDPITVQRVAPGENRSAAATLHQGGMVSTPDGQWWAVQMQDFVGVGRTLGLCPVTWEDGWPYLGLPGNLTRSPRTYYIPQTKESVKPHAPYFHSDDFNRPAADLTAYGWWQRHKAGSDAEGWGRVPAWQWNHNPEASMWDMKGGRLNLRSMPADQLLRARNSLTQRMVGPVSTATVTLDGSRLKAGDVAGLGIQNIPHAWIGLSKSKDGLKIAEYDLTTNKRTEVSATAKKVYLRVWADLDSCMATLSYSLDGHTFTQLGDSVLLSYQLRTFQGGRWMLFNYNETGVNGGTASFDDFTVDEPQADRSAHIPYGKTIRLRNLADGLWAEANPHGMLHPTADGNSRHTRLQVEDCGHGLVALKSPSGYLRVVGRGYVSDIHLSQELTDDCKFLWQDMLRGQCMLLCPKTNRYVGTVPGTGDSYSAQFAGSTPNRRNGCVFQVEIAE